MVHNHWDVGQRDELIEKGHTAGLDAVPRIRALLGLAGTATSGDDP